MDTLDGFRLFTEYMSDFSQLQSDVTRQNQMAFLDVVPARLREYTCAVQADQGVTLCRDLLPDALLVVEHVATQGAGIDAGGPVYSVIVPAKGLLAHASARALTSAARKRVRPDFWNMRNSPALTSP